MMAWDRYSLAGKDYDGAIAALSEAVAIEDTLPYDEPPAWHAPVRQSLGAVLLAARRPAEAETAYREELRRNPENGWSLFGLEQALRAQGRKDEAKAVAERFERAWMHADINECAAMLVHELEVRDRPWLRQRRPGLDRDRRGRRERDRGDDAERDRRHH